MNKGTKYYTRPIVGALIIFTLLLAQGSGYLSQKLMVENNIRDSPWYVYIYSAL